MMMNLAPRPSRIDFEAIDQSRLNQIVKSGGLDMLTPAERQYFSMMELVRGLRARMLLPGGRKIVTKAGIIRFLKGEPYGLSDWMARRIYADSLNFFYSEDGVSQKAWRNYYAERFDKLADLSVSTGNLKEARGYYIEAAKLRGCYEPDQGETIPPELLDKAPVVVYTADAEDLGAPKADTRLLEERIDSFPDIPELRRERLRQDAGLKKRNLLADMLNDVAEYGEEE